MVDFSADFCSVFNSDALGIAQIWRQDLNVPNVQRRVSTRFAA